MGGPRNKFVATVEFACTSFAAASQYYVSEHYSRPQAVSQSASKAVQTTDICRCHGNKVIVVQLFTVNETLAS